MEAPIDSAEMRAHLPSSFAAVAVCRCWASSLATLPAVEVRRATSTRVSPDPQHALPNPSILITSSPS